MYDFIVANEPVQSNSIQAFIVLAWIECGKIIISMQNTRGRHSHDAVYSFPAKLMAFQ